MLKGIHLSLLAGPAVPLPVPKPVMDALASVQVTSAAGSRSGFQISFVLENNSPLHTLLVLTGGRVPWLRVLIVATLNSLPLVMMDGLITKQEVSGSNEPGQSTLTVTGEDLSVAMDQQEFNGIPYPAMPAEARVALVVAKYAMFGMVPLVIPQIFSDVPIPVDKIPTHEGTDLAYVQKLAKDAGYVFYVDPGPLPGMNTAYWGPEIKLGAPQPALNLGMDAHSNVESLSFAVDNTKASLPIVFIQNALTKFPIPLPIPDISLANPPLGLLPPLPKSINLMKETAKLSPMAALSKGLAAAAGSADVVTATGSLDVLRYGNVLKARQLVGVRGAGPAFDGLYYVKNVSSTFKAGEFKQNFTLTRNGLISTLPRVPV
ncbi:hypothetical protein [Pseudogulbenkiania ferrooxidans]|uniref:Phage protein D n=1 Tax=Pseudogulbenkiania ferrooxidans 2002 TaxID=279714 RepID=B9Z3M7_9NEIS|nr:hypothetical protein [Pseudogulbenkiania ferrooxidans]EEG08454.1 conserved hypothetical protein [Pseudogulbenkiania ferrooxidans 2002]